MKNHSLLEKEFERLKKENARLREACQIAQSMLRMASKKEIGK